MKNSLQKLLVIATTFLLLTGCGHVRSAKSLIKEAKLTHGKCEVVSKTETDEMTKVVLKDKLQGFEYEIVSSMSDISIDGSSFGSLPGTTDKFESGLQTFVIDESRESLEAICKKYGATYETYTGDVILNIMLNPKATDSDAINAVEEVAALMQEYNVDNRMDGYEIFVSHDEEWLKQYYEKLLEKNGGDTNDYVFSSAGGSEACHIGSARLPECKFRNPEEEREDYYHDLAKMKNSSATFVRKEEKTFADVGIPLYRAGSSYYSSDPKIEKTTDPVTFYYYDANGTEFFICNFIDSNTGTWYTNYDDLKIKPTKEKKKLINIHFHFGN